MNEERHYENNVSCPRTQRSFLSKAQTRIVRSGVRHTIIIPPRLHSISYNIKIICLFFHFNCHFWKWRLRKVRPIILFYYFINCCCLCSKVHLIPQIVLAYINVPVRRGTLRKKENWIWLKRVIFMPLEQEVSSTVCAWETTETSLDLENFLVLACGWYLTYVSVFVWKRTFFHRFQKKNTKFASTRSVFRSFSPVHTNTLKAQILLRVNTYLPRNGCHFIS